MLTVLYRSARIGQGFLLFAGILVIVFIGTAYMHLPVNPDAKPHKETVLSWPTPIPLSSAQWNLFVRNHATPPQNISKLAGKYRLAGTFFTFSGQTDNAGGIRKAIVDNLNSGQQHLLAEQSRLDQMQVARILRDHIVLSVNGREEVLWLSFSHDKIAPSNKKSSVAKQASASAAGAGTILEENRFGKRVGDRRWVMQRADLLDYYEELLNDPERLANIYISLAPDYSDKHKIAGYKLDITGEGDFFNAVGLKQNDVIRKVNSMKMSSQTRAEYFLSEFAKNRISALVLDIERDNEPVKLIYLVR